MRYGRQWQPVCARRDEEGEAFAEGGCMDSRRRLCLQCGLAWFAAVDVEHHPRVAVP
ncbi:hypothetical protein PF003_g37437 [Phytophthora fragariae]|nr:hypothetical protein PF003_g37437 [Phytophthora fragariae]